MEAYAFNSDIQIAKAKSGIDIKPSHNVVVYVVIGFESDFWNS